MGGDVKNQKQKNSGTTPSPAVALPGGQVLLLEAVLPLGRAPVVAPVSCACPPGPGSPAEGTRARGTEGLAEGGGPKAQWGGCLWGLTGGETTDLTPLLLKLHFLVSKSLLSRKKALLLPNSAHPPRAETRVVWAGDSTRGSVGPDRERRLALGAAGTPGPASLRGRRTALLVGGLRPQPLPDLCCEALEPL